MKLGEPFVGQRIITNIPIGEKGYYARGAYDALNGKLGEIVGIAPEKGFGAFRTKEKYLVRFDEPAASRHSYQLPVSSFWFEAHELDKCIVEQTCSQCHEAKDDVKIRNFGFGLTLPACDDCVC